MFSTFKASHICRVSSNKKYDVQVPVVTRKSFHLKWKIQHVLSVGHRVRDNTSGFSRVVRVGEIGAEVELLVLAPPHVVVGHMAVYSVYGEERNESTYAAPAHSNRGIYSGIVT